MALEKELEKKNQILELKSHTESTKHPNNVEDFEDQTNYYDAQILGEHLLDFLDPEQHWPVKYKDKDAAAYKEITQRKDLKVITAIGQGNTGKSMILSMLLDLYVPSNSHQRTQALSVLYPKDKNSAFACIKTPSANSPILFKKSKKTLKPSLKRGLSHLLPLS